MNRPVFITGVERSGSSFMARILDICGAFTGPISTMYENLSLDLLMKEYLLDYSNCLFPNVKEANIPVDWWDKVQSVIDKQGYHDGVWMLKSSKITQMWPVWNYAYPKASWILIRRRTGDIIESCMETAYMKLFKDEFNCKLIGASNEQDGWLWWVHQYEKQFVAMIESGLNCKIVWPEHMAWGDYQQIYETLEWLGLKWNPKIVQIIDPLLEKGRRKAK